MPSSLKIPQEYAERLFKQARSLDFMERDIRRDVDNGFYVTELYKFIKKRQMVKKFIN